MKNVVCEKPACLSVEELQQAPIIEVQEVINLGSVKAGKKLMGKFAINNAGMHALILRRVLSNDSIITLLAPKTAIKNGKKVEIKVDIQTEDLAIGNYSRQVTVISNYPKQSVKKITLNWVVE